MPLSRVQKNCLRSAKSPKAGTKSGSNANGEGTNKDVGTPNRQFKQTGKKYVGPSYAQLNLGKGKPINK
jgi:hypothetical protein